VLALALSAFVADRAFLESGLSGPREAVASPDVTADASGPALAGAGDDLQASRALAVSALAGRLDAIAKAHRLQPEEVKDAFHPSSAWVVVTKAVSPGPPPRPVEARPVAFARTHRLGAVVVSGSGGSVIIDGQCVNIGQSVDGFRLVSVGKGWAVLVSDDGDRVTLRLPEKRCNPSD